VTGGRYTDVIVDPTSLRVKVCGPPRRWRLADRLSYGTAEQIYLLLRVALAEHLTRGRDTCPLLLDDVTVHADAARTRDLLDLLLRLSTERQIVVFTQEELVAAWAREHLAGPEHTIVNLSPVAVG
jgi:DNA repair protein SbcC/Rad50